MIKPNCTKAGVVAIIMFVWATLICVPVGADPLSPEPHRYTIGSSARDIPFKMIEGHITVPVRIDGSRELQFALDCGIPFKGIDLFHKDLSDEFIRRGRRVDYALPGIEFLNQKITSIANEITESAPEAGLIGLTLFASCVAEIDFQNELLSLIDPAVYEDSGKGEVLELVFVRGLPCVEIDISVDGEESFQCLLVLDLGSPGTLLLWPGGTCQIAPPTDVEEVVLGAMVSGDIRGKRGSVASLRLGSQELRNIPASFASKRRANSNRPDIAGCAGTALLNKFTVVFDYSRKRILLKPNDLFDRPFTVPAAGAARPDEASEVKGPGIRPAGE